MHKTTVAALLLFAVLGLVLTYPLALHLADAVEDRQDALLNVWITAWDGHQLLRDPLELFDANIFHPYPRTLAYSELLLGNALLALPITAASGNPVLGYNMALLLSFVLSGFGTFLLVLRLTRSPAGGLVAGLIFAYSSYRLTNLAQAQLLTTQWLPFALLSLFELLRRPRLRHVATFILFFCLQALSSFYYGLLLAITVLGVVVFDFGLWIWSRFKHRTPDAHREASSSERHWPSGRAHLVRRRSSVPYLLLAAGCCALILLPFALPYLTVQRELGFERSLADSEPFSASLQQYLMVPPQSVLHARWLPSDDTPIPGGYPVDALFPGLVTLGLALWGVIRGQGRTRWFFFLLLLVSFLLSLGPRLYLAPGLPAGLDINLPYAWLYSLVPGFKALRAPVRFDALVQLSLAVLAGYGVATLGRTSQQGQLEAGQPSRMAPLGMTILLAGLVLLESLVWPAAQIEQVPVGDQLPPVYRWLAEGPSVETHTAQRAGPILELPMAFSTWGPQLDYQYLSTYHWRTTPDGYSGFIPPKRGQIAFEMESFPSERSVSLLQALGVTHVILHTERYPDTQWSEMQTRLSQMGDLAPAGTFGADRVYQVQPRANDPDHLDLQAYFPPSAAVDQPYTAYMIAVNDGSRSYAVQPTDTSQPAVTWETAQESTTSVVETDIPLVTLPEGGVAVMSLPLTAPEEPGSYRLVMAEEDGPLGAWAAESRIEVGDSGDSAFPVPAQLVEWSVPPEAHTGHPFQVDLTWRALGKIDAYYSVYVKLLDAEGNAVTGWDGQPQDGGAPTLLWSPGGTIDDSVTLTVPFDAPPGQYTVEAGMYRAQDLAPALTLNADRVPVDRLVLGTVRVEP